MCDIFSRAKFFPPNRRSQFEIRTGDTLKPRSCPWWKNCDGALLDFRTSFFSIFSQGPGFSFIEADFFFHALDFVFHGLDFADIFTGTNYFSRVVSKIFSREGSSFHGLKTDFFHGLQKFFHGEKKNTDWDADPPRYRPPTLLIL